MEMFYVCVVQYGSHSLHVANECLKYSSCDWKTQFLNLFNLNLSSHMCLVATVSDSADLEICLSVPSENSKFYMYLN